MPRVLVVDDEPGVRAALTRGLGAEGMDVVAVGDGPAGLAEAASGRFDAVVLDVILPGMSGYRVLERLRADGVETPVLLLSVLVAQLRAVLRRRGPVTARIALGSLVVDPDAGAATWEGRDAGLSHRELAVLHALASRPGTVVTKDELLERVWGDGAAARNVVEVYVGYLRRKLTAVGAGALIATERGRGYRLAPP